MMDREQFTSAVLAAEPTLYRVAKTMLRSEHDCARYCAVSSGLASYDAAAAEAIPAPAADDYSDLYAAITALEEKLRLPVELYYLEGFKTREIAGMLGIPENTVKTRLRAAREHLRKDLKGACFA